jgi:hypothetical protein
VAATVSEPGRRVRLRGTSVVALPLGVVGVMALAVAVATAVWGAWSGRELGVAFWATLVVAAAVGAGALVAIRGCFVEVRGDTVRDVVGWVGVRRVDRARIGTARVRAGAWRVFELELDDGRLVTLLGASPQQFPARLLPDARDRDLADLDAILEGTPPDGTD